MLQLPLIVAHESENGFVWWDEALMFLLPIALGVMGVLLIARRARSKSDQEDDEA